MARTKEFDPDAALQSALELFWERGYAATSLADLVEHLGVARASLYATFGDKRALYEKALARYREQHSSPIVESLSQPGPALPAVRALVRRFADEASDEVRRRKGCFVVNAAVECSSHESAAARVVEANFESLETALTSALLRARAQGELPADREPRALARMLVVLLQGTRVVGMSAHCPARLRDATEQALALLE